MGTFSRDEALVCITYGELIDTIHANFGAGAVKLDVLAEFRELCAMQKKDAVHQLLQNMGDVLKEVKAGA